MISDSKLLASAAWDAQSLNELKAKAGEDPAANIRPVARQVEGTVSYTHLDVYKRQTVLSVMATTFAPILWA